MYEPDSPMPLDTTNTPNAILKLYLIYICKSHVENGVLEGWFKLFIEVIEHFNVGAKGSGGGDSIQTLMDRLAASGFRGLFTDTSADYTAQLQHIEDTVMYILGTWTTMLSSFVQQRNHSRKVLAAYKLSSVGALSAPNPDDNDLTGKPVANQCLAVCETLGLSLDRMLRRS